MKCLEGGKEARRTDGCERGLRGTRAWAAPRLGRPEGLPLVGWRRKEPTNALRDVRGMIRRGDMTKAGSTMNLG